jgi:multisubunit Na+/H+ antiporter MnhB subunit
MAEVYMSYEVNPKDNHGDDTEVQAALVVIVSHVLVPFIVKSIAYMTDQVLNWFAGDSNSVGTDDISLFEEILVPPVESSTDY